MTEVKKPEMYQYAIKNRGFNMWLDNEHIYAKNGILSLTKKQHDEVQALIAKGRYDISTELTYLDAAAAEAIAKKHMQSIRPQAHQGGAHSGVAKKDDTSVLQPANEIVPKGMTVQERLRANRENMLTSKPAVIENDAIHASDVAPASKQAAE